ncbi:MAG: hypothetical protein E7572_03820 [Ruminococcaceae bacterium]|nr:hypothetical protein [Oscillospiraceae bacterium]
MTNETHQAQIQVDTEERDYTYRIHQAATLEADDGRFVDRIPLRLYLTQDNQRMFSLAQNDYHAEVVEVTVADSYDRLVDFSGLTSRLVVRRYDGVVYSAEGAVDTDDSTKALYKIKPEMTAVPGPAQFNVELTGSGWRTATIPFKVDIVKTPFAGSGSGDGGNVTPPVWEAFDDRYIMLNEKGQPDGVPTLNNTGKVPYTQLPLDIVYTGDDGLIPDACLKGKVPEMKDGKVNASALPNTVVTLNDNGKIPSSLLPDLNLPDTKDFLKKADAAAVATSGKYSDLKDAPVALPANGGTADAVSWDGITGKPDLTGVGTAVQSAKIGDTVVTKSGTELQLPAYPTGIKLFTVALPASGWSDAAPYSQAVSIAKLPDKDGDFRLIPAVAGAPTEVEETAFSCITGSTGSTGNVTFLCRETKPETDINVRLVVYDT